MTPFQIAYKRWVSLFPGDRYLEARRITYVHPKRGDQSFMEPGHFDGECCNARIHPGETSLCCAREQAWREYCLMRDGTH